MRAVPRLCIVYPGICPTTEENHGNPQSGYPKGARLISAERDSFSRLGHHNADDHMDEYDFEDLLRGYMTNRNRLVKV